MDDIMPGTDVEAVAPEKRRPRSRRGFCPECGHSLTYDVINYEGPADEIAWEADCMNCHWVGYEHYSITFLSHTKR